jgi:hypothetical protein
MGFSKGSWALWSWIDIPDRNDPTQTYLRRLRIIRTPLFALYLHFIFLPDDDRHLHSHPWRFSSLVLRGGYTEDLTDGDPRRGEEEFRGHRYGRLSLHRMPLHKFHRITEVEPGLVTLVFVGREVCEWGFWTEDGFVTHQEYDRLADSELMSM